MNRIHFTAEDHDHMRRALELARKGWGLTNPNPLVGAVAVRDGQVLGEGWHTRCGAPHAEVEALAGVADAEGATLYVTLEPCCHTGKTPPCTDLILKRGIRRVVYAASDPNPIAGGGGALLKAAGLEVASGLLEAEALQLNEPFFHYIRTRRPFVAAKYAMTLDGRIAAHTGDARWISGPESRAHSHGLRQRYMGILAGIGTVLADDPELSVRDWAGEARHPLRVILDAEARTPLDAKVLQGLEAQPTLIAVGAEAAAGRCSALEQAGARVVRLPVTAGRLDLSALLEHLGASGIDSLLVEGGGRVHGSFFDAGLVDRYFVYIAPKLIGGSDAPGPIGGVGLARMADALELKGLEVLHLGNDLCLTGLPLRTGTEGKE